MYICELPYSSNQKNDRCSPEASNRQRGNTTGITPELEKQKDKEETKE